MGLQYELINLDKKERISFSQLNTGGKVRELAGTVVVGSIVTRYMLKNIGERIAFIDDHHNTWQLFGVEVTSDEVGLYRDVTDEILQLLLDEGIYLYEGIKWIDQDEGLFDRLFTNTWDPKVSPSD